MLKQNDLQQHWIVGINLILDVWGINDREQVGMRYLTIIYVSRKVRILKVAAFDGRLGQLLHSDEIH